VLELIHSDSNPKFDICVAFIANYSFSGDDAPVDNEMLLVTDFVNLKIKPALSFRCAHRGRVCVFINMCMSIYVYTVFLKKFNYLRG
jgi:hypothetical protein